MRARECGFAYEGGDVYSNCQWCVRVSVVARVTQLSELRVRALLPLVRESELVLARTKKGYYVQQCGVA